MICRIWNLVAFIGIVSTSTDYSSLRLVEFFAENDILIRVGSCLCVDLLLIQLFGSVLDRFVLRENIGLRVRISCYLRLHHACCFARIVSHVQPLRSVWNVYTIYLLSEKIVDLLRYVTIAILFVFGVLCLWPIVQWSKMSVRSVPVSDKLERQNVQETLSEGRLGTQLRRSSRVKVPSNTDFESRTAERANTLKYSCAGYIATLTRLRGNIQGIIKSCGTLED